MLLAKTSPTDIKHFVKRIQMQKFNIGINHTDLVPLWEWVSQWLNLTAFFRLRGPCSPYKPCNYNLYIGIIIFPHIDNTQPTGYN